DGPLTSARRRTKLATSNIDRLHKRRLAMQLVGESVAAVSGTQWNYDFLAFPGNRPNWVPKWGFKTEAPTFDPRFDIGGQFGGWHYGVKAYGGVGGGGWGGGGGGKRGRGAREDHDYSRACPGRTA